MNFEPTWGENEPVHLAPSTYIAHAFFQSYDNNNVLMALGVAACSPTIVFQSEKKTFNQPGKTVKEVFYFSSRNFHRVKLVRDFLRNSQMP